MSIWNDIALWFWRLIPANPIMVRVVSVAGKRTRHLLVRLGYLVVLFVVMLVVGQGACAPNVSTSLVELAKQSTNTFFYVSVAQLLMMCFIAPIFTAAAITQEKDSNTLHILLTTPLSNSQIVFGSLLSRLYFVWVLLLAGVPIFCITMLFGGVTLSEVLLSVGLAGTTALLTGSLAISISVIKVGTRRTIIWFFVGVTVYLLAVGYFGTRAATAVTSAPLSASGMQMSWLAPFHPFLALAVVTGQTPAPSAGELTMYSWPWTWMLASPATAYMTITTLLSLLLVGVSVGFLRKSAKEGEITFLSRFTAFFTRQSPTEERRRKPRVVWDDPIAWREAATRASAGGRSVMRWVLMAAGILAGVMLLIAFESGWWGLSTQQPNQARDWLSLLTLVNLVMLLFFVCSSAASSLTREKESQSMELLQTTPLTSGKIVYGTARGLMQFAGPMIIGPTVMFVIIVFFDLVRSSANRPALTTPEVLILLPLQFFAFAAVAATWSLLVSLKSKKTVKALMVSVGVVIGVGGILAGCGEAIAQVSPGVAAALRPFFPFNAMQTMVDYASAYNLSASNRTPSATDLAAIRITRFVAGLLSAGAYLFAAYVIYSNIVREYDMVLRKQSA